MLIESAFELLSSRGSPGTTVRAVCTRARLNPRYFYESFADLDALVVAVYDDVLVELEHRVGRAVGEAVDDDGAMRAAVEETVQFVHEDRRRGRMLYAEALGNRALGERRIRAGARLVEMVQRDHSRRGGGAHDQHVGAVGAAVLAGGFSEVLVRWLDGHVELSAEEVADIATGILLAVRDATRALDPRSPTTR